MKLIKNERSVGFLRSFLIRGIPLARCLTPIPADPLCAGLVSASYSTALAPPTLLSSLLQWLSHSVRRTCTTGVALGLGRAVSLLSHFMQKLSSTQNNRGLHQMFEYFGFHGTLDFLYHNFKTFSNNCEKKSVKSMS